MVDIRTKEIRSYTISRIRSKNTIPENIIHNCIFNKGYRFRLHAKKLTGSHDIALSKHKIIIFAYGCFYQGHVNCHNTKITNTRTEYWTE